MLSLEGGYSLITLLICLCLGLLLLIKMRRKLKLPPGPRGLPILGFLPFLNQTETHIHLEKMREKYGDVFGMYMGSRYYFVMCDLESTKEAFNREEFTFRPAGAFRVSDVFSNFGHTFGQHWIDHRKLASRCLRQQTNLEAVEEHTMSQISLSLDRLKSESSQSETGEVNLREAITQTIVGMSCVTLWGKTSPADHDVIKTVVRFLKDFAENGTAFSLEHYLPWLKPILYLLLPSKNDTLKTYKDLENFLWSEIDSHVKNDSGETKDFMDFYLAQSKKSNMESRFTRADLNGDTQLLLFAGTDTTRVAIEWLIMCMAKYSEAQEKVYQEICQCFGTSGTPTYDQKKNMPYTEAAILESLRFVTLAPINPMHSTGSKVTSFRGYDIPEESVVISCLWSINNDPKNWRNPSTFYPEHFLSDDGKTVTIPEAFVPFSTGKRICVGEKSVLKTMFLYLTCLLQRFQVLPPDGGVDFQGKMRVSWEACFPAVKLLPRNE